MTRFIIVLAITAMVLTTITKTTNAGVRSITSNGLFGINSPSLDVLPNTEYVAAMQSSQLSLPKTVSAPASFVTSEISANSTVAPDSTSKDTLLRSTSSTPVPAVSSITVTIPLTSSISTPLESISNFTASSPSKYNPTPFVTSTSTPISSSSLNPLYLSSSPLTPNQSSAVLSTRVPSSEFFSLPLESNLISATQQIPVPQSVLFELLLELLAESSSSDSTYNNQDTD